MIVKATERLCYRQLTVDDADMLFELESDPEVLRYINGGNPVTRKEFDKVYIPRMESFFNAEQGWGLWKIGLKPDDTYLGWILIRPMGFFSGEPEWNNIEIGWRLKKEFWGKGYATEAALNFKNALFNVESVNKITALAEEGNAGSIAIMKKIGMNFINVEVVEHDLLGKIQVVIYEVDK
ncbi:GNAT family N-acetyltransferase [Aliikangiella maris]